MRVLAAVPMSVYSGYGNDGIGLVQALLRRGIDVRIRPTHIDPPLPPEVAQRLTMELEPPFDLYLNHVDPLQLRQSDHNAEHATMSVGWTMWESTSLGMDSDEDYQAVRENLTNFDLILAYDPISLQAMTQVAPVEQLGVLQGGYAPEFWGPAVERDWFGDRFSFIMCGQLHDRKDPFVAIQAFQELKQEKGEAFEGAELHLKTNIPGLHPAMEQWCPKLRVHYATWPQDVLKKFYQSAHVLLAPSRGEGKNVPAMEMMTTGGAVIATDFGGHSMWLSNEYAYGLDYQMSAVNGDETRYWASASKDHLKELMWHVFTHREEVKKKADIASRIIPQMCSWDAVVDRLMLTLSKRGEAGQQVYQAYKRQVEQASPQGTILRATGSPVSDQTRWGVGV